MAKTVIRNPFFELDGVDRTGEISEITTEVSAEELDATTADTNGYSEIALGLKRAQITLNIKKEALNQIDDQLWNAFEGSGELPFVFRADQAARSDTNPEYTGTLVVTSHRFGAAVGGLAEHSATFPLAGALTRNDTP